VAVKVLRPHASSDPSRWIRQFHREAGLQARVRHPGLAAVLEVGKASGRPYLVMEFVEGRTLAAMLADGTLPEERLVSIARAVASVLQEIHRHRLVHRDLKPHNIVIDRSGIARVIDFGFAARMGGAEPGAEVVGTFAYSSPEQTGMMRRAIDGRSDLYALGAILFECAAGRPPFQSSDVGELLRLHATQTPPPLAELNPNTSPGLCAIIARLLAKDPNDRYQTAAGLIADLDRLPGINAAWHVGGTVSLGGPEDVEQAPSVGIMVGREAEMNLITVHWRAALRGSGSAVVIEGGAGSGKTRLVQEVARGARQAGALVLYGRSSAENPIPLEPLREALEDYRAQVAAQPALLRARTEEAVRGDWAAAAPLLRRLSPTLADMLDAPSDTAPPAESTDGTYDALVDLLVLTAARHRALLLCVEDAHRMDEASREVLRRLAGRLGSAPVLLLVTTRLEARDATGALADALGEAVAARVQLAPLDEKSLARMIGGHLGAQRLPGRLVEVISGRCHGNPLAAEELLYVMIEEGYLRPSWGRWVLSEEGLEALELSGDVARMVVQRIHELDAPDQAIMRLAAAMGARVHPALVAATCDVDPSRIEDCLARAAQHKLVELARGEYRFMHDRIREALLEELPAERLRDLHQSIARTLDAARVPVPGSIYALARHYASGNVGEDPRRVYLACLQAGLAATADGADNDARGYLEQALRIGQDHDLPLEPLLPETLGDVCYRTGRLEEAEHFYSRALELTSDSFARGWLRARVARAHLAAYRTAEACAEAQRAFEELGEGCPSNDARMLLPVLGSAMRLAIGGRRLPPELPAGERERRRLLHYLYELCGHIGYLEVWPWIFAHTYLKSHQARMDLGISPEFSRNRSGHAVVLSQIGRSREACRALDEAMATAESLKDLRLAAHCRTYRYLAFDVMGDAIRAADEGRNCLTGHARHLDTWDMRNTAAGLASNLLLRGHFGEAWRWVDFGLGHSPQAADVRQRWNILKPVAGSTLALLGRVAEGFAQVQGAHHTLADAADGRFRRSWTLQHLLLLLLEREAPEADVDALITQHEALGIPLHLTPFHIRPYYIYAAYARVVQALAGTTERAKRVQQLARALVKLRQIAGVPALACHRWVLEAYLAYARHDDARALRHLGRAESLAAEVDHRWGALEVSHLKAAIFLRGGWTAASQREAARALELATACGWTRRARRLRQEFILEDARSSASSASASRDALGASGATASRRHRQLDLLLQMSAEWSRVFDPGELIRLALGELIRTLGAERAFLFLCDDAQGPLNLAAGRNMAGQELFDLAGYSRTVVEQVRDSGRPLLVSASEEGVLLGSQSVVAHDLRSIVAAPLKFHRRVVGVLYLDNRIARGLFGPEDVALLQALGAQLAVALETARAARVEIHQESERQHHLLAESLHDLTASSLDLADVFERLLNGIQRLVRFDSALGVLADARQFRPVVCRIGTERVAAEEIPRNAQDAPFLARLAEERAPLLAEDVSGETSPDLLAALDYPVSLLGIPLLVRDRLAGMVCLGRKSGSPFTTAEASLAFALTSQASASVENARLYGEQNLLLAQTRHRFLMAQIRPHFLFNALNTIAAVVAVNPAQAEDLIVDLADFLHQTFAIGDDWITLREEKQYLEAYLALERVRFGDRLRFEVDFDQTVLDHRLPSMLLQPLVENAIRHGVSVKSEGGRVEISARPSGDAMELRVEDDGVGFDAAGPVRPSGTGVGLGNVRERAAALLGPRAEFTVDSGPGLGTRIRFRVPGPSKPG